MTIISKEKLIEVLERTQRDINWMLNNKQFLNHNVFDYIEATIQNLKGGD